MRFPWWPWWQLRHPTEPTLPWVPARSAGDVVVGVNAHFSYPGVWANTQAAVDLIRGLGVHVVRQRLPVTPWQRDTVLAAMRQLTDLGVSWWAPIIGADVPSDEDGIRSYVRSQLDVLELRADLRMLVGIGGVNEPNGAARATPGWAERTRTIQRVTWEEVRARRNFDFVQVGSAPLNLRNWDNTVDAAVTELGDLSRWCDVGDSHVYQGAHGPEAQVEDLLGRLQPIWGAGKPVVISETGWTTPDPATYTGGGQIVDEATQAAYLTRLPLAHLAAGRTPIIYELLDDGPDQREAGFGLVRCPTGDPADWTPKPGYHALQTVLALLARDSQPPTPLRLSVQPDAPIRQELVARAGSWMLCLWRDVDTYTWDQRRKSGAPLPVEPVYATVQVEQAQLAALHVPASGYSRPLTGTQTVVAVTGTLTVIEIA